MVHIGCGADVIRQRRRADQLKKDNEAKGIYTIPPDFKAGIQFLKVALKVFEDGYFQLTIIFNTKYSLQ